MLLSKLHPNERWDLLLHKEPGIDTKLRASGFFRAFGHQGRKSGSNNISDKVLFQVLWSQDFTWCKNLCSETVVLHVPVSTYPCISNLNQNKYTFL